MRKRTRLHAGTVFEMSKCFVREIIATAGDSEHCLRVGGTTVVKARARTGTRLNVHLCRIIVEVMDMKVNEHLKNIII